MTTRQNLLDTLARLGKAPGNRTLLERLRKPGLRVHRCDEGCPESKAVG